MDAVRGCGDYPPCPGFKHGGTYPTEEVLSASCLLHDGTGIQSSHLFVINNRLKALTEDEGQEEMFMKIIKSLSLILLVMAVGTTGVYAYDFEKGGIYYNILSEEDRTVEVTYIYESGDSYSGDIVIPQRVINDGKTYSVTTIGENAFDCCDNLKSISMPSVTTIGNNAFRDCSSLASVFIPASCTSIGINPFAFCTELKELVVDGNNPNYSSADGALYDKGKTTLIGWPTAKGDIDIMPSVTSIGNSAFSNCYALTSVSMPSVTSIGNSAFNNCYALTSVSMPSVTTIGNLAFISCGALTSVSMPSVTTIGEWAFNFCSALTSLDMPSVTTIGDNAFKFCYALTSLDIPASVSMIGNDAFYGCSSLTAVYCHWDEPLECDPLFTDNVLMNATLYVPVGTIDAYGKVDPWRNFWNIEEGNYSGIAETPQPEVTVKVIDGAITVEGGDMAVSAPTVEVYSAGGVCVYRGTDSSIGGLTHGVYVVRVGDAVHKVAL